MLDIEQIAAGLVFTALGLVAPGLGIQRWLRLAIDPALVLPLGAVQAAAAYWLGLATGQGWLFPALIGISSVGLLRGGARLVPDRQSASALVAPAMALVALLAVTQYPGNRPAADGGFLLDLMGDQPLHAGSAWELVLSLTCMEPQELENVFALLLLGSFVGFPAPPTFLAVELLPFMEPEMQILGQRAEDACDMLGQMMGSLGVD